MSSWCTTPSLIHLHKDAKNDGALDKVSAFPFENYLGKLKFLVRRPQCPVPQIVRRITKQNTNRTIVTNNHTKDVSKCKGLHNYGPLPPMYTNFEHYQRYEGQVFLTSMEGNPVLIQNILVSPYNGDVYLVYNKCKDIELFYNNPLESTRLGISMVSGIEDKLWVSPTSEVKHKMVFLMSKDTYVAIPVTQEVR